MAKIKKTKTELKKVERPEVMASIERGLSQEAKSSWEEFKKKHGIDHSNKDNNS